MSYFGLIKSFKIIFYLTLINFIFFNNAYSNPFSVSEKPKNLGSPINSSANEFSPAISPDGKFLIFNSKRNGKYQDLYISYNKNGKWAEPQPMNVLNSPYNDETPFISSEGNLILFSSDRDGSKEMARNIRNQVRVSFDIYWSKKINGIWTKPGPIPGTVNTIHHEKTPSISKDGKTIYYSSWLFGNMKSIVLVKAEYKGGAFINPTSLPKPFNMGYRDITLIPAEDQKGFFFSSVRPEGFGGWDLYFISYEKNKFGEPVNLGNYINSSGNEIFLTRVDQRFFICSNRSGGVGRFDIYSSFMFKKDSGFETRAINFDSNSYKINKGSSKYLNALSKFLKENNKLKLEIIGHTDLHGPDEFNLKLSLKRAGSVLTYLVSTGLDKNRFRLKGAGESQPVIKKTGKGYDEKNRRTEFKIIK